MKKTIKVKSLKQPIISVIIPLYNNNKYIEKALDSVINQKIGLKNIQIIIVDDKSTDNSWEIIQRYAKKYPDNILAIQNKKNSGVSFSRNEGMKRVQGKYLAFFDSDDILPLDAYKKLVSACEKNGTQMAIGGIERFYEDGKREISDFRKSLMINKPDVSFNTFSDMWREDISSNKIYLYSWLITELNMQFDINATQGEDTLFIREVISQSSHVSYIPDIIYYHRRRGDNETLSSRVDKTTVLSSIYVANKISIIYKKFQVNRECISASHFTFNKLIPFIESANLQDISEVLLRTQEYMLNNLPYSLYAKQTILLKLQISLIKLGEFRKLLNLINVGITRDLIDYLELKYENDIEAIRFLKDYYKQR